MAKKAANICWNVVGATESYRSRAPLRPLPLPDFYQIYLADRVLLQLYCCYGQAMQRTKPKWRADHGARALKTVSEIEASIGALHDEDLLDLQDIFAGLPTSVLETWASNEIRRRNLVG